MGRSRSTIIMIFDTIIIPPPNSEICGVSTPTREGYYVQTKAHCTQPTLKFYSASKTLPFSNMNHNTTTAPKVCGQHFTCHFAAWWRVTKQQSCLS